MIESEKIRLWAIEKDDLIKNYLWANDPELIYLAGMQILPKSYWEITQWYESILREQNRKVYAIKTHEGDYIGNIELNNLDWRSKSAEIGLIIGDQNFRQKGFGNQALQCILELAFKELGLNRLSAHILEYNKPALDLFEKVGFKKEGIMRKAFFTKDKFHDIICLGILSEEYKIH